MSKLNYKKAQIAKAMKEPANSWILPDHINAMIDEAEEMERSVAVMMDMIKAQREARETSVELGNMELANECDMMIERLWAMVEDIVGPCAEWDDSVVDVDCNVPSEPTFNADKMRFYTFDYPIIDEQVIFLDLCYTTEEQGETWNWFLCLNNGSKQQFRQKTMDRMKLIAEVPLMAQTDEQMDQWLAEVDAK